MSLCPGVKEPKQGGVKGPGSHSLEHVGVPKTGAGPEALDSSFPRLTCMSPGLLCLLHLYTAGYKYHQKEFSGLGFFI